MPQRKEKLDLLVDKLKEQGGAMQVEVLTECDSGEMCVGAKRNRLLERAQGEYVCFVDDDDDVTDDYVDKILEAIKSKPSCVGISGRIFYQGEWRLFHHSIEYGGWYTGTDGDFYRTPNHLNPVRREIALDAMFDESKGFGEDHDYSLRLRPLLETEIIIEEPIYIYNPH
jgi:glycosyltransferase involved in cell wall biosynthesis